MKLHQNVHWIDRFYGRSDGSNSFLSFDVIPIIFTLGIAKWLATLY